MGKAFGDEELAVVVLGEFHGYMLSEGGRADADIDGYVENGTAHTTYELGLREGRTLEMQATNDTANALTLVVLDESNRRDSSLD